MGDSNMNRSNRLWLLALLGLTTAALAVGCAQREHKKVEVRQEQHEGEVHEEKPGEMVVE